MRAFIDTSSLFKKYVAEEGSEEFASFLQKISEIVVSPTCWIEINAVLFRLVQEKKLTKKQTDWLLGEIKRDFNFFGVVLWNKQLEEKSVEIVQTHSLKTLDSIQLAAGFLAKADFFATSDKKLFGAAKKVLKNVHGIGI